MRRLWEEIESLERSDGSEEMAKNLSDKADKYVDLLWIADSMDHV